MSRTKTIEAAITSALSPSHLEVVNESHMHSVAPGSETHFKVVVVSAQLDGVSLIARHRKINDLLKAELASGLHALSIHAFSPDEWANSPINTDSPACRGGAGK